MKIVDYNSIDELEYFILLLRQNCKEFHNELEASNIALDNIDDSVDFGIILVAEQDADNGLEKTSRIPCTIAIKAPKRDILKSTIQSLQNFLGNKEHVYKYYRYFCNITSRARKVEKFGDSYDVFFIFDLDITKIY